MIVTMEDMCFKAMDEFDEAISRYEEVHGSIPQSVFDSEYDEMQRKWEHAIRYYPPDVIVRGPSEKENPKY